MPANVFNRLPDVLFLQLLSAKLGGWLGFAIGASILSVLEIYYLVYTLIKILVSNILRTCIRPKIETTWWTIAFVLIVSAKCIVVCYLFAEPLLDINRLVLNKCFMLLKKNVLCYSKKCFMLLKVGYFFKAWLTKELKFTSDRHQVWLQIVQWKHFLTVKTILSY